MTNKPIDEMSLRHLFSTNYSSNILRIEYWGPVLNNLGQIEPSPDCLVLDKRHEPYRLKRCEFKYIPASINDFRHNGNFDIAVIWDLPNGIDRNLFYQQLRDQNNCLELIVLNDMNDFRRLPEYSIPAQVNFALIQRMTEFLLTRDPDVIFSAYLIARAYPNNINSDRMVDLLVERFQRIRQMQPQGRGNAVARFLQMNPPLIISRYGRNFCWNDDFEPTASINTMERLMRVNFMMDLPNVELLERIR